MSANVERVLSEIRALSPEEIEQVRKALDGEHPETPRAKMTEEEFERHLLAKGIISSIPTRSREVESFRRYKPARVKGKPVSETIIEERR